MVVDVSLLGHAGFALGLLGVQIHRRLVPQQETTLALTGFQLRITLLEAVDELRHVGLVGLPEKGHGVYRQLGQAAHFSGQDCVLVTLGRTAGRTMHTMQEIELKFQIPEAALAAVQAELAALDAGQHAPLPLKAAYFDTPDRALAAARMALRVRQEGDEWVQTLKAGGSNTMMRLEDNQPADAPPAGQPIAADLSRHLGRPAEQALKQVLSWDTAEDPKGAHAGLIELYRTDIVRTRARVTVGAGTPHEGVVELALDLGHIHAGTLSVPVRELEIESVSGHPMAVIDAGRDWVQRHGLWLDTQTKAHRGDRLARQAAATAEGAAATAALPTEHPTLGHAARIRHDANVEQAWRAGLEACLEHIAGNMSELATGPNALALTAYQWRLALRRLRALARLLDGSPLALPASTLVHAAALNDALGRWRDAEALAWLPARLFALGGPMLALPCPTPTQCQADAVVALSRSAPATSLCLDVLACLLQPVPDKTLAHTSARDWLAERLDQVHARCVKMALQGADLSDEDLHKLRRLGKRVRLGSDLFSPLWRPKRQRRHERVLKAALDALGRIQDEATAEAWYTQAAEQDPRALFGQGWLQGRRQSLRKRAQRSLERWLRVNTPW